MKNAPLFQNSINLPVTRQPQVQDRLIWDRLTDGFTAWMVHSADRSRAAQAAKRLARVNAQNEKELAARGLTRADLAYRYFGSHSLV